MRHFEYTAEDRKDILASLSGPVFFGTQVMAGTQIITVLENRAEVYFERLLKAQPQAAKAIESKIDAVRRVMAMLKRNNDEPHIMRLQDEIYRLETDLYFFQRPKQKRARLRFIVDAFEIFARADDQYLPFAEYILLSDSEAPAARFFRSAIYPVCVATGEELEMRQAIKQFNAFKDEMRKAEIGMIKDEIECATN